MCLYFYRYSFALLKPKGDRINPYCAVPENVQTHPKEDRNSKGEGHLKDQFFKGKYDAKIEFPVGMGEGGSS